MLMYHRSSGSFTLAPRKNLSPSVPSTVSPSPGRLRPTPALAMARCSTVWSRLNSNTSRFNRTWVRWWLLPLLTMLTRPAPCIRTRPTPRTPMSSDLSRARFWISWITRANGGRHASRTVALVSRQATTCNWSKTTEKIKNPRRKSLWREWEHKKKNKKIAVQEQRREDGKRSWSSNRMESTKKKAWTKSGKKDKVICPGDRSFFFSHSLSSMEVIFRQMEAKWQILLFFCTSYCSICFFVLRNPGFPHLGVVVQFS